MEVNFEIDGIPLKLAEADDRIVFHMQHPEHSGSYEPDSLVYWAKSIKPDTTVIDVGAYTGLFSIIAAKRGAKVYALEPMPNNINRIARNAANNNVSITYLPVAATDWHGPVTLHYNQKVRLTTGASLETGLPQHNAAMIVSGITIDSLGLQDVSAMKIDVERHEPCVLRGAMQTIERCRPTMLIETLDDGMRKQVLDLLPSYEVAKIIDRRNTLFAPK